jgi:hypothetical protein
MDTGMHAYASSVPVQHRWLAVHALSHRPQWRGSYSATHRPPQHSSFGAQAVPQVPQLVSSVAGSVQAKVPSSEVGQQSRPAAHA